LAPPAGPPESFGTGKMRETAPKDAAGRIIDTRQDAKMEILVNSFNPVVGGAQAGGNEYLVLLPELALSPGLPICGAEVSHSCTFRKRSF